MKTLSDEQGIWVFTGKTLSRRAFLGATFAATFLAECSIAEDDNTKLTHISASELARRIAKRDVTCVEVMKAYIDRINEVNPKINAIVQMRAEGELLDEARRADRDLMDGRTRGPLHGVPFTLKDNIETQGIVTTCGFPELAGHKPRFDATVAKRLKSAGGILLGKTNVPEFLMFSDTANCVYGRTKNPYDLSRFTGGSSGGEGAIVAACGSAFGIGTDIGSSIREPSHYCGIAGLKPTNGRVPDTGILNCFPPFNAHWNSTGPMARYVEDLAMVTRIISGPDEQDPNTVGMPLKEDTDLLGLRVAYFVEDGLSKPTEETQQMVRRCAQILADAGAKVTEARPKRFEDAIELWVFGMVPELGVAMRQWREEYAAMAGARVSDERLELTNELFEVLDFWSKEGRYSEQRRFSIGRRIQEYRSEMHSFMQDFDAIVCPVMNGPADLYSQPANKEPRKLEDEYEKLLQSGLSYCMAFNITGWPAASVPVGRSSDGLPFGVQVASKAWREDLVFTVAKELEQRIGGWRPPTL